MSHKYPPNGDVPLRNLDLPALNIKPQSSPMQSLTNRIRRLVFVAVLCPLSLSVASAGDAWKAAPMDWPHWRGPEMNGISRETGLVSEWSNRGQNVIWKSEELAGRCSPIVMNGKLYIIVRDNPGTKEEGEKVVCVDALTGEKLWQSRFNVFLSDVPDTRVGWSSVVGDPETGNVFALGVCGYFQCLNGETGETIWSHSMSEEYGLLSTYGGRTNFPIIHENLVIISAVVIGWGDMAKPAHRFIAFDKRNGVPVWFQGTRLLPYDTTYSSPVYTVINGQPMIIFGSGDGGVHAFQPQTGKNIWTYNVSKRGIDTTPVVAGNVVISGHSQENRDDTRMGALFALDATLSGDITSSGELWRVKEWYVGKSSPIVVDGRIYACEDSGALIVADLETGELIQELKLRGPMRSSPVYADGKIYLCTENGVWWTLKPTESGVEKVYSARLRSTGSSGTMAVSHGRLYIPLNDALYCVGQEDVEPHADPRPERPAVDEGDDTPALVQVVPVETLLKSGDSASRQAQDYQVRLYNSNGQFLRLVDAGEAEFSIEGPGEIDANGRYTAPTGSVHASVNVNVKVGDLEGGARIRVVPELPWSFDFSDGQVPVTWVGARYRNVSLDFDFLKALEEKDPQAAQLYIFLISEFINNATTERVYDDTTPRRMLTFMLDFLKLNSGGKKPETAEDAKQALDSSLQILADEKFLDSWEWSEIEGGLRFTVRRGTREVEGNGVMLKITTIPLGTRSQSWMGHPGFQGYTIQADVQAALKDNQLPDIGLIAQRYTLDLMGASQQLQIRTWTPQLRMASTVRFEWKPYEWYTLKLQASVEDGKAVLKGKAWPRGESEPEEWTVQAEDPTPNLTGSPGLYGAARPSEIFYDNVSVTPN